MKNPARSFVVSLTLLLSAAAISRSASGTEPSAELRQIIPDVDERLASPDWSERQGVFDLLVVRSQGTGKPEFERLYDLPASDYGLVLTRVFEGLSGEVGEGAWPSASQSMPAWVDTIQTLHLESAIEKLALLTKSDDSNAQMLALLMLRTLDARQYDQEVARLLSSDLRTFALETLIAFESKAAVPALIEELGAQQSMKRFQAIQSLESIGDASAVDALIEMANDPTENNRLAALKAVELLVREPDRNRQLIPMARRIAENSEDPHVSSLALAILIDQGVEEFVPEVIHRLTSPDAVFKSSMQDALGLKSYWWKSERSVDVLAPSAAEIVESLDTQSGVEETNRRIGMVVILGCATTPDSIRSLRIAAMGDNVYVQRTAVSALGERGAREAVPDLIALLETAPNCDADRALALIRDRRAIEPLMKFFEERPQRIKRFVSGFNERYDRQFDRVMEKTKLVGTIKGRPDQILDKVSEASGIPIVWHGRPTVDEMGAVEETASYEGENLKTAIGRPLLHINRGTKDPYLRIWEGGEVHLVRQSDGSGFLREVFERDFK